MDARGNPFLIPGVRTVEVDKEQVPGQFLEGDRRGVQLPGPNPENQRAD